jgi:dolichol-phosphate mannosyltransferase
MRYPTRASEFDTDVFGPRLRHCTIRSNITPSQRRPGVDHVRLEWLTWDIRVSTRFLLFMLVGASGLLAHLLALKGSLSLFGFGFDLAQTCAASVAMTWNFFLNNLLTYRDRRLKGWASLQGLLSFYSVCSVGAVANVGVASWVYGGQPTWWLAGTAGALMGGVFNYAASSTLTWHQR